jgi:hypothetical protein
MQTGVSCSELWPRECNKEGLDEETLLLKSRCLPVSILDVPVDVRNRFVAPLLRVVSLQADLLVTIRLEERKGRPDYTAAEKSPEQLEVSRTEPKSCARLCVSKRPTARFLFGDDLHNNLKWEFLTELERTASPLNKTITLTKWYGGLLQGRFLNRNIDMC